MYFHLDKFYILANRFEKRLGFYLIEFDEKHPNDVLYNMLISEKFSSEIGDANLSLIDDPRRPGNKYLVAC